MGVISQSGLYSVRQCTRRRYNDLTHKALKGREKSNSLISSLIYYHTALSAQLIFRLRSLLNLWIIVERAMRMTPSAKQFPLACSEVSRPMTSRLSGQCPGDLLPQFSALCPYKYSTCCLIWQIPCAGSSRPVTHFKALILFQCIRLHFYKARLCFHRVCRVVIAVALKGFTVTTDEV
jgi:hypothetical protein